MHFFLNFSLPLACGIDMSMTDFQAADGVESKHNWTFEP